MQNFTLVDTLGALKGCIFLAPFIVAPGYVFGWALNLFEFRQRRLLLRFILAIPLSIAICPMLSYLLARFFPPALWAFYVIMVAACLVLLAKEVRGEKLRPLLAKIFSRHILIGLGITAFWVGIALVSVVDLQIGDKLYPPIIAFDHSVRTAMTVALAHHVPPTNPFFANAGAPLRYHYLWLLFCSLPVRVARLSGRDMVDAGVIWCGLGLLCTVALGMKFFVGVRWALERKTLLAVGLLAVTGLDILPTIYIGMAGGIWLSDMEAWNNVQITSWAGSMLWVPHNVAALIACFVGFLLLRHQVDTHQRWAFAPVVVAGMAFASAAGMSVYVTFTFVVAVALWLLSLAARKQWLEMTMFVGAGLVALCFALSFLLSLHDSSAGQPAGAFAEFAVRPFIGVQLAQAAGIHLISPVAIALANAALLPLNYALELGFFLAVGIVRLVQVVRRKIELGNNERAAWTLVATSFLVGTFFRSATTESNDLGWRCFLPAQLIFLLWGATLIHDWWFPASAESAQLRPLIRVTLATLLILGTLGTAYQVFMIRMFPPLYDRGAIAGSSWLEDEREFGARTYALRTVYESLDAQLTASAVFQNHPNPVDPIPHMLYSGHEFVAGKFDCGVEFGGDPSLCQERIRRLGALFDDVGGDPQSVCQDYGIDVLVALDTDAAWQNSSSWVWSTAPIAANRYVRAFACRKGVSQ